MISLPLTQLVALLAIATTFPLLVVADDVQVPMNERRSRVIKHEARNRHAGVKRQSAAASWSYLGCYVDAMPRVMTGQATRDNAMTPDRCTAWCQQRNYALAGMENGTECWCSNAIDSSVSKVADSQCSVTCPGDSSKKCGASWRLSVYRRAAITSSSSARPSTTTSSYKSSSTVATTSKPVTTSSSTTSKVSSTSTSTSSSTSKGNFPSASVIGAAAPPAGPSKGLYAHHMVGNTYSYDQSTWADDMNQAYAAGIDGFALNMGGDAHEPNRAMLAYRAAEAHGRFKLFFSLDVTSLGCSSAAQASNLANIIATYAKSSAQAKIDNKIVVSTFAGENCQFGQSSMNAGWTYFRNLITSAVGQNIYLIPSIFSDPSQFGGMSWMDGEFNWNSGWPMGGAPLDTSSDTYYRSQLGSKGYMPAVSPAFFTYYSPSTWNKNWIYRGDDWLLARRMEQLVQMRNNVVMAELVSWNDYGESHYVGPIRKDQPNSQGWTNGMPHTAWLSVIKYYAPAFKTGAGYASTDLLVLWSRPHPKAANPTSPSMARPRGAEFTEDNLYAFVVLSAPSSVTVYSGSNSASWDLPAGINKLSVGSAAGTIGARITRGGQVVKNYDSGNAFSYKLTPTDYNYNYFVAEA